LTLYDWDRYVKRFTLQISVTLSCTCIANTLCLWQNDKRRRHRDCADKGLSAFLFRTSFCGRISICVCVTLLDKFTGKFTANTQKQNKYNFAWLNKYTHTHTHTHANARTHKTAVRYFGKSRIHVRSSTATLRRCVRVCP
jgi:hypothetical protein